VRPDLPVGQRAVIDGHAEDRAVKVIEERIRAGPILGTVADAHRTGQEDGRIDARPIDTVDIEGRCPGGLTGDEDQMGRHARIGGHAVVVVEHAEDGRAVGAGVVPLLVLQSDRGVAEIATADQAHARLGLQRVALDDELIGHLAAEGADVVNAICDVRGEEARAGQRDDARPGLGGRQDVRNHGEAPDQARNDRLVRADLIDSPEVFRLAFEGVGDLETGDFHAAQVRIGIARCDQVGVGAQIDIVGDRAFAGHPAQDWCRFHLGRAHARCGREGHRRLLQGALRNDLLGDAGAFPAQERCRAAAVLIHLHDKLIHAAGLQFLRLGGIFGGAAIVPAVGNLHAVEEQPGPIVGSGVERVGARRGDGQFRGPAAGETVDGNGRIGRILAGDGPVAPLEVHFGHDLHHVRLAVEAHVGPVLCHRAAIGGIQRGEAPDRSGRDRHGAGHLIDRPVIGGRGLQNIEIDLGGQRHGSDPCARVPGFHRRLVRAEVDVAEDRIGADRPGQGDPFGLDPLRAVGGIRGTCRTGVLRLADQRQRHDQRT